MSEIDNVFHNWEHNFSYDVNMLFECSLFFLGMKECDARVNSGVVYI